MKKYNLIIAFENLLYMLHEPWIGNFYYRQCGAIEGSILRYDMIQSSVSTCVEDDLKQLWS